MKKKNKSIQGQREGIQTALKMTAAFLIPFLLVGFYLLLRGISVTKLYLPNSVNNDTLFYYKMVEGIVEGGMPKGYFGFNESHALIGTLGAWSPVILLPWVIWGYLFGFSYSAMLVCNLVLFGLSLAAFVFLAGMKWRQLGAFSLLCALFPSLSIHLLSGLPEVVITAIFIVFLGICIRMEQTDGKTGCLIWTFVLGVFLTLIRPYLFLCLFLPGRYLVKRRGKFGVILTGIVTVATLITYYVLGHFFTSPYFEPLFDLGFVKLALRGRFVEAYYLVAAKLKTMLPAVWDFIVRAFRVGLTAGTQYVVALVSAGVLFVSGMIGRKQSKTGLRILFGILCIGLFGAVILFLGKANEGGRHFFLFAVSGILLCSREEKTAGNIGKGILAVILVVFLSVGSLIPTDYDVPVRDQELVDNLNYWTQTCLEKGIEASNQISYDNTVVWVLQDWIGETYKYMNHRELFALPRGLGVNCCMQNYVVENWERLQCRYIATIPGGTVEALCQRDGLEKIGQTEQMILFRRY